MGFWDSFQVYNRSKHSDPRMYGGNHSNIGEGKTTYLYSKEYYQPKTKKMEMGKDMSMNNEMDMNGNNMETMRKSSVSSESSASSDGNVMMSDNANMVDISKLSSNEFKKIYESMRRGEPDNKVNF